MKLHNCNVFLQKNQCTESTEVFSPALPPPLPGWCFFTFVFAIWTARRLRFVNEGSSSAHSSNVKPWPCGPSRGNLVPWCIEIWITHNHSLLEMDSIYTRPIYLLYKANIISQSISQFHCNIRTNHLQTKSLTNISRDLLEGFGSQTNKKRPGRAPWFRSCPLYIQN